MPSLSICYRRIVFIKWLGTHPQYDKSDSDYSSYAPY
jgi:mRNA-degrading endonuclease HigB of HigAB toxin-antitoxin module